MNKEQLLHSIENPNAVLSADNLKELEELVKVFPYFQGGHVLIAKSYHESGNVFADKKIKKAAVYTSNRKKLKNYISAPTVTESVKTETNVKTETLSTSEQVVNETVDNHQKTTSLNEDIKIQLEKLQEIKKEVETPKTVVEKIKPVKKAAKETPVAKKQPVKAKKTTVSPKVKPAVKDKKSVEKKSNEKQKVKAKTTKKANISSSRLGDALYEINDLTENTSIDSTPDILLDYLEHIQAKKRTNKKPKKDQINIIDSFIKEEPSISRISPENAIKSANVDLSQNSSIENTKLISENLALIYARQGNISKSISIYEELILKNPLKKAYFASQIEKLKN